MVNFTGIYSHNIDSKGRIAVPAKFREALGDTFEVTNGLDGCLFVFTSENWDKFSSKLQSLPMIGPSGRENRRLARYFLSSAVDVEPDKLGRILLPQALREHAKLLKDCVSIGVGSRIEIWSKENWEKHSAFDDIDELEMRMAESGLEF